MRSPLPCLTLLALAMLTACGTKTPLTLPPGHAQPPLFGTATPAKPAPTPAPTKADDARATTATTQTVDDNKPASGAVTQ